MIRRFLLLRVAPLVARYPKTALALVVLYALSPFDIFPEAFTGLFGFLDDAALLVAGWMLASYIKGRREGGKAARPDVVDTTAEIKKEEKD